MKKPWGIIIISIIIIINIMPIITINIYCMLTMCYTLCEPFLYSLSHLIIFSITL